MPTTRHIRANKHFRFSSLVLDVSARKRLTNRDTAAGKLAEGEVLSKRERKHLRASISRQISYDGFGDASIIGMHWNAVRVYIHNNDPSQLEQLQAKYGDETGRITVYYGKGKKRRAVLETSLTQLRLYADFGLFEYGQELDLEQVMSSNWVL
jgi:hypothetical protein